MKISEKMQSLKFYIENNVIESKENPYYNESFYNVTADYFSSKGEFSNEDIDFLHENNLHEDDFVNEEYEDYKDYMSR